MTTVRLRPGVFSIFLHISISIGPLFGNCGFIALETQVVESGEITYKNSGNVRHGITWGAFFGRQRLFQRKRKGCIPFCGVAKKRNVLSFEEFKLWNSKIWWVPWFLSSHSTSSEKSAAWDQQFPFWATPEFVMHLFHDVIFSWIMVCFLHAISSSVRYWVR